MNNFIYFSSGKDFLHNRTILSVLSLINNYTLKLGESILIYTDKPEYYKRFLSSFPIEYYLLDQEKIQEMMGADNLIHRVKIGVIEDATNHYPKHNVFYIDSDTFFHKEISQILNRIDSKNSVMHKFEYEMSFLGTYLPNDDDHFRLVFDTLTQKEFILLGQSISIKPESFASWNAGIIGLHYDNFHWLKEVYEFTDQLYAATKNHACEQYAFSYFLQKRSKLTDCEQYNRHYWHKIEKKIVDEFLKKNLNEKFAQLSLDKKQKRVGDWCSHLLKKIPRHEYTYRYNAMIAFQEKYYLKGYKYSFKTLFANPLQDFSFFKDIAYYTKKMLFSR